MQIVIPMSGTGQRFINAGYKTLKPLIEVDGKPIIEHVVNLFPNEENFIFICNSEHIKNTNLKQVLLSLKPNAKIIEIEPHKKGPVWATLQASDLINDDEEVIVNYCDFGTYWDYEDFLRHTRNRDADGAIPCYKGFHPHMIGDKNYAFVRDEHQWMLEIREKKPFTDNRMSEYASNGTYYFKKGSYVKKYFKELMQKDINVSGEYYVSMVYNLLVQDNLKVSIYEIQHMQQWGTPEDFEEYVMFSKYFESLTKKRKVQKPLEAIKLIPMAGRGQRFADEGYKVPKPLIEIGAKPMVIQASDVMPSCSENIFVCLEEHLNYPLKEEIKKAYPDAKVISLSEVTQGQACTCEIGLKDADLQKPLFICACDNSMTYDEEKLQQEMKDNDVLTFSFRNNPASKQNPKAYGWLKTTKEGFVEDVSVKIPISDTPQNDHAIVGSFYFKKAQYFLDTLNYIYKNNVRVNNEFYVDSCIGAAVKLGLKTKVFETDTYICWGTPNDLRAFEAYQSLFHKLDYHSYSLDNDFTIDKLKVDGLDKKYRTFSQESE